MGEKSQGKRELREEGGGEIARSLSGHAAWLSIWFGWTF